MLSNVILRTFVWLMTVIFGQKFQHLVVGVRKFFDMFQEHVKATELLEGQVNRTIDRLSVQEGMMAEMLDIVAHLQNQVRHQDVMIREMQAILTPAQKVLALQQTVDLDQATSDLGSTSTLGSIEDSKDREVKEKVVKNRTRRKIHPLPLSSPFDSFSLPSGKSRDVSSLKDQLIQHQSAMRGTPLERYLVELNLGTITTQRYQQNLEKVRQQ